MADRELQVIITAQDGASRVFTEISGSAQEAGASVERAGEQGSAGAQELTKSTAELRQEMDEAAKAASVVGGAITTAFVAPMGAGAKAAWDQVSAVEQATFAMSAYGESADDVQAVLRELTEYAEDAERSGGIFWSEQLYDAAQQLIIVGVELENVSEYVQIMSRAVGLGTVSFDELSRVLQRVISSGSLTGIEFEMLTQWGFQIDESFRNTTITTEELFAILDEGIPADALLGQADTIEGALTYLQGALVGVGQELLGVNDDLTLVSGGLGDQFVGAIRTATELLETLEPAASFAGEVLGTMAEVANDVAYAFLELPDPIQNAITGIVGITGGTLAFAGVASLAIPRIVSMVGAIKALPAAVRAATMAMGPVGWIITGVTGALTLGAAAWGSYRRRVNEVAAAIQDLEDARSETGDFVSGLPEEAAQSVRDELDAVQQVIADFTDDADQYKLDLGEILMYPDENQGQRLHDGIVEMLDSDVGGAFMEWAEANKDSLGEGVFEALVNREHLDIYGPEIIEAYNQFFDDLMLSVPEATDLEDTMRGFWEAVFDPDVDTDGALRAYQAIFDEFARTRDVDQFRADIEELTTSLEEGTFVADAFAKSIGAAAFAEALPYIVAHREELDRIRETVTGILEVIGEDDLPSKLNLVGMGNDATYAAAGLNRASENLDTLYRVVVGNTDGIAQQSAEMESWITSITAIEEGESRLLTLLADKRITQEQYNAAMESSNVIQAANAQIQEDVIAIQAMQAPILAASTEAMADYVEEIRNMNDGTVEGQVRQMEALGWMDEGLQGTVAQTLEIVGHLQTLGSEGEDAFRAMADSAAATNPYLFAMYETMGLVHNVVRDEDGRVISYEIDLGGADSAMSEIERLTMSIDALTLALGGVPPLYVIVETGAANSAIDGVIAGLDALDGEGATTHVFAITRDAETGITRTRRELEDLDGESATVEIHLNDYATAGINAASWALSALDGMVASTTIQTIYENSGIGPGVALGGVVQEYASGGVVVRAGEVGPEIAHFANGGTALIPRDGLYSVPSGSYITPNHAVSNYGGDTVFNITVNGGDADQIKRVFTDEIVPGLTRAVGDRRVGMGGHA